ncbi:MAG: chemotaxis protein CheW [Acidimicrobiales bacterium]
MSAPAARGRYCSVEVGELRFAIDVAEVQEVLQAQPMTRTPLAPAVVAGLINLRGLVVPAIDLRRRLELPPRTKAAVNVIVHGGDGPVSLLVDAIGDVVEVDSASFEEPPDTLRGTVRPLVRGVFKLEGELLLWLDLGCALDGVVTQEPHDLLAAI